MPYSEISDRSVALPAKPIRAPDPLPALDRGRTRVSPPAAMPPEDMPSASAPEAGAGILPPIDRRTVEDLRDALGEIAAVIEAALEEVPARLADLRRGVEAGDAARIRRQAHTLAGSVANLGAREVARLARALEALGRCGDLEGASGLLSALEAETARLLPALAALSAEETGAVAPAQCPA